MLLANLFHPLDYRQGEGTENEEILGVEDKQTLKCLQREDKLLQEAFRHLSPNRSSEKNEIRLKGKLGYQLGHSLRRKKVQLGFESTVLHYKTETSYVV